MTNLVKLQHLLIGMAGNEILTCFGEEFSQQTMEYLCYNEYCEIVDQYLDGQLIHFPHKSTWLQKAHLLSFMGKLLNGVKVWYMFKCSKRYVTSQINPLFRELILGESLLDLCREIRENLWNKKHFVLRSRRKSLALMPLPPFDGEWEPNEWFLFLYCGVNGMVINCYSEVVL